MNFQQNTKQSFKKAKQEINELKQAINTLNNNQQWLIKRVYELQKKEALVASKESNKVHASNCPFANNIKAESRLSFESLKQASLYGYEGCECVI